jgi:alanine dehydrogenase
MTLLLSNDDVDRLLTMEDVLGSLESAYRELGEGTALNTLRVDLLVRGPKPNSVYGFKTMSGSVPGAGVAGVRLNSDIVHWPEIGRSQRRVKIPSAPGNRYVGLVLLFSTHTGEPLAIFPDGCLQRLRVGATNGLGAKYLAREDASVVALFGSGWQAATQLMAICAVRKIEKIRVFSPTAANRKAFAEEMEKTLKVEVRAVDGAEQAVKGSHIVAAATNSVDPVLMPQWIEPGMHLSTIRHSEIDGATLKKCDVLAIHHRNLAVGIAQKGLETEVPEMEHGDYGRPDLLDLGIDWNGLPELSDLAVGRGPTRRDNQQVTCFLNPIGFGMQFAAVGARLVEKAKNAGAGKELPTDWFTETVHP